MCPKSNQYAAHSSYSVAASCSEGLRGKSVCSSELLKGGFTGLQASVTASCDTKRLSLRVVQGSTGLLCQSVCRCGLLKGLRGQSVCSSELLKGVLRGYDSLSAAASCSMVYGAKASAAPSCSKGFYGAMKVCLPLRTATASVCKRLPLEVAQGSTGHKRLQLRAAQSCKKGWKLFKQIRPH